MTRWGMALCAVVLVASCRDNKVSFGPRDTGAAPVERSCEKNSDCGGNGVCMNGLCESVKPCSASNQCDGARDICHPTRGFCVECDGTDPAQCTNGKICQSDFTCVSVGGADGGTSDAGGCSGTCTDRTMCGTEQVCRGTMCCPPPARCTSPVDCPVGKPECNGANGLCFGGDSCMNDNECESRAGCGGGACFCDQPAAGQPGTCKSRPNECDDDNGCRDAMGMYVDKYCAQLAVPRRCLAAPTCQDDVDCALQGLLCDTSSASDSKDHCVSGARCPMGTECTPTQLCEGGACVGRNCINTPTMCTGNDSCNIQTGRCENVQTTSCMMDTDCNPGFYCNLSANVCLAGCRDSSDCSMGICNASHMCEQGSGMLCGACTTDADCPGGTTCYESPLTMAKTCRESCNVFTMQDCVIDPSATCVFTRCACGL